ncbi:MAG TPA: hypothetical protein VGE12_19460, partial [Noviherbaspirillum sp.]
LPRWHTQKGVVLIIALIVLVAMTLASIAMVRSIDTSTVIAGNLAFKQSAVASGDAGIEAAVTWLSANGDSLTEDSPTNGYYATSQDSLDLTAANDSTADDLDWSDANKVKKLATDAAGNNVAYIIHRMCNNAGALNGATCATEDGQLSGSSLGAARQMSTYQPGSWTVAASRGYYRITVRVTAPRNTISYVQAFVSR